jgi:ABC-type multidrug transport system fused ATPase/permease subunit
MTSPIIETRDLNFSYRSGVPILHNINVAIMKGQNVGLVGESGALFFDFCLEYKLQRRDRF